MLEEKVGSELPGEALDVNPEGRPPHPRVIVEVAGLHQLFREMIHDRDPTPPGCDFEGAVAPFQSGELSAIA